MGEGPHGWLRGWRRWHNELADGCKGLLDEDHLGEKISPRDITHKMVGNRT